MRPTAGFDETLRAARRGDGRACRRIWADHAPAVTGFLRARGTVEIDEVVNDTFVAAFRSLGTFEGDEVALRAWLIGIARHKRADAFRAVARRTDREGVESELRSVGGDAEEDAVAALADAELRTVLADLTPEQRDVVVLRFVSDLSLEQTAAALGRPVGAIKALQHRALRQLRKRFAADPYPGVSDRAIS